MKIVTIVGARPQFIKAAAVSRAIEKHNSEGFRPKITEILVHTGQHYDDNMSALFFRELEIPEPDVNLNVGSGSHAQQTGQMLIRIEEALIEKKPDLVMVYGDTNSTLAGALTAAKLEIPVAHIEAGLRSFNRKMPEEHNRVLTDHLSDLMFCPTQTAAHNLEKEGITNGVHLLGDVMYDSVLHNIELAENRSHILQKLGVKPKRYALATVHRAENTDNPERLESIFKALQVISVDVIPVIVPCHPRTQKRLSSRHYLDGLVIIDPLSYFDMLLLEKNARVILTDSGGVQKESFWFKVPCITLREETEWMETIEEEWNILAGTDQAEIVSLVKGARPGKSNLAYGDGEAAGKIVKILADAMLGDRG
jgi:UDP-N-acetylglucosamine 2-epimerase